MTEEEKKAIELAKKFIKEDFSNPMGWSGYYDTELKELSQAIEIVLNILNEKDTEIEHWKKGFERELEYNRKNTCELLKQDLIIREKDKQIDLMSEYWHCGLAICENCVNYAEDKCKICIKQYFEQLAKEKGE